MISIARQTIPSDKVGYYAKRVINDLGIKEPPVLYIPILEYFGIGLQNYSEKMELEFTKQTGYRIDTPAFLLSSYNSPKIYIRESETQERRRLSIFHECGHYDLPWHEGHNFFCDCSEVNPKEHKKKEREAFEYAARLMFPDHLFFDDLFSLPVSIQSIELLAKRYNASFIATAINFVKLNPSACAFLMLKYNPLASESGSCYQTDYSVKSKSFHRYWNKGEGIGYNDHIQGCFEYGRYCETEIPAMVFGSNRKVDYKAFLRRYGNSVFALLTLPSIQSRFI